MTDRDTRTLASTKSLYCCGRTRLPVLCAPTVLTYNEVRDKTMLCDTTQRAYRPCNHNGYVDYITYSSAKFACCQSYVTSASTLWQRVDAINQSLQALRGCVDAPTYERDRPYLLQRSRCALLFQTTNVFFDLFGGIAVHPIKGSEFFETGGTNSPYGAEMFHQGLLALGSDTGDFV